jgi:hypothetical protein
VAEPLVHMLGMPYIKEILPPSLRAPADLTARETGAFSWVPDGGADPNSGAWSSAAKGGGPFRSQPLAGSRLPYLSFECHGDPAGEGRFLGSEEQSGTAHAVVPLAAAASSEWRRWSVPHPGPGGHIVAFADPPFAFRKPVELGRLTFWSERLLRHGGTIKTAGLLAALFALALTIWARRPFVSKGLEPSGQGEFDGPGASVAISTSTNRTGTSAR